MTLLTMRARAAMADAARIQHTERAVVLWPAFLHIQRMARRATQRAIGLQRKRGAGKAMGKGGLCPVGWPV